MRTDFPKTLASLLSLLFVFMAVVSLASAVGGFEIREANIEQIQQAFMQDKLTSRELVEFYLQAIRDLNPHLHAVIEVNPDALNQADKADQERRSRGNGNQQFPSGLHGIPVILKDSIGTKDELNTTAGSFALLGSSVARDAGVVSKLRKAGAIILGKASLSEWYGFRSFSIPNGWSARGGFAKNPYVPSADPCGSSTGSAVTVAANLVAVSLGTETHSSIICPSSANSVVGIKPTVGLTSRAGVIPVSPRHDTIGPICRSVLDAVYVLDEIVGFDPRDEEATREAAKFIPAGGYKQFLRIDGLKGKRLGVVREPFFDFTASLWKAESFETHLNTLRKGGAILVDNLEIANIDDILDPHSSGELTAMFYDFKSSLNSYLLELSDSPVKSLADIIAFNTKHSSEEMLDEFGQENFIAAENTSSLWEENLREAVRHMSNLSRNGFEKTMKENGLDAMVTPESLISTVLGIGGFPGISVPAGYDEQGVPFGICFGGLRGFEPRLIEIAYSFEKATNVRRPPPAWLADGYTPGATVTE